MIGSSARSEPQIPPRANGGHLTTAGEVRPTSPASGQPNEPRPCRLIRMPRLDHEEIIALSEDPNVTFEDVPGRPPTPEEHVRLDRVAERAFLQCAPETQARLVSNGTPDFAVRVLGLLAGDRRSDILSRLPTAMAEEFGEPAVSSS